MKKPSGLMVHVLRDNVFIGAVVAYFLIPKFGLWGSLLFLTGTILMDVDHYLQFLLIGKFKHFSPQKMVSFCENAFRARNHPDFLVLHIFHTVEFHAVLGLVAFYWAPVLLPVFWGFLFHMVVDFFHMLRHRALTRRVYSFLEYFIRKNRIEACGGNPEALDVAIYEGRVNEV